MGGDDLQPAAFLSLVLRFVQLTLFLGPIVAQILYQSAHLGGFVNFVWYGPPGAASSSGDADLCRQSHRFGLLLTLYAAASALTGLVSILLDRKLAYWSSQGSPTHTEPRNTKVTQIIELKLVPLSIVGFLVWVTGVCATIYAPNFYYCVDNTGNNYNNNQNDNPVPHALGDRRLWWIAFALLSLSQILEVMVSFVYLLHLFALPPEPTTGLINVSLTGTTSDRTTTATEAALFPSERYSLHNHELHEEMWADRCAKACRCLSVASCFLFGGHELLSGGAEFGDVARALADYLETRGVLDVVPSDVVVGLLVLQRLQRQRIREARRAVVSELARTHSLEEEGGGVGSAPAPLADPPDDSGSGRAVPTLPDRRMFPPTAVVRGGDNNNQLLQPLEAPAMSSSLSPTHSTFWTSLYRLDSSGNVERLTRSIFRRDSPDDMRILEEGARYAKYALAIYTWILYLYVHPVTGVPRLLWGQRCRSTTTTGAGAGTNDTVPAGNPSSLATEGETAPLASPSSSSSNGRRCTQRWDGDNLCQTHKAALLLTAGLTESDLVYAQLHSGFSQNPYCILLDHAWQSVVVSIRGTFSLEDCVTDVLIDPESLEPLGREFGFDATNQYCHGGVLACVRNVYRDLQRHQLLHRLLVGETAQYPHYTLRLVGHSLGAATCTILSYMLRPTFPTLRVVNYSPPGCSLTWELAVQCRKWCSSFVLDGDLVPRLTRDSMERLRDEVLELIAQIKVPKIEVAQRLLVHGDRRRDGTNHNEQRLDDILDHPEHVPDSEYRRQLERFKAIQLERRAARGCVRSIALFPPGRMVHLVKTGEIKSCWHGLAKCLSCFTTNSGYEYVPVWIHNDDLNEIVIKPTMGTDHFPNRIQFMLEQVANDFGLNVR